MMDNRVVAYILAVYTAAVVMGGMVYNLDPSFPFTYLQAALCFGALSVLAHTLRYKLAGNAVSGSMAFLLFLTTALLAPHWITVVTVACAATIAEVITQRTLLKALFNVSQNVLAIAASILFYSELGGNSLLEGSEFAPIPYIVLFVVFLAVNTLSVSGVIAISERRNIWQVWKQNTLYSLTYDLLALPFVYGFALLYAKFGTIAVVFSAIPLLVMRQLYKTNWQLEQTNQELLELMVAAIEARDPYTSGHSRRVSRNARLIAKSIGLRGKTLDRIAIAALLHDVGKIHEVFGPILSKPGKLTSEEDAIMRTHPIKSAELVARVTQLSDIVEPVKHHHENWNGSGYPHGLKGEQIPLASRIIMFADTIDAMTTDRPYRAALNETAVRTELIKFKGKQFDPNICDILLKSPLYRLLFVDVEEKAINTSTTPVLTKTASA